MASKITIPLKIKTGTEQQILDGPLGVGELALSTDTKRVWSSDLIAKHFVGEAIVDIKFNLNTVSGVRGSFYFAEDTRELFIGNSSNEWLPLQYTTPAELLTTSGDIVSQMSAAVTLSGIGGIYTTKSGNTWYISPQDQMFSMPIGTVVGHSTFSVSGTTVSHNLETTDHFLTVIPAGTEAFNEYEIASVGNVYIQLGFNDDIVWNTGGEMADGIQFFWEATTDASYSVMAASTQDLLTLSGSLITYFDTMMTTLSGQTPIVSVSGVIFGTGALYYGGATITHNVGTLSHYVVVTPADTIDFDEMLIASIGGIYVKRGENQDIVYHTGGESANGIKFDWEVVKHGLKMVE